MTTSWSFSFDSLGTPGHLRRSANGPASISWHNFQRLRWLVSPVDAVLFDSATCTRSSQLQRWDAAKRRFPFRFQKVLPERSHMLGERHKWMFLSDLRLHIVELRVLVYSRVHLKFCQIRKRCAFWRIFRDMCCTSIMSDTALAVGLFWRNDLGCASVVPSEQTSISYIILDMSRANFHKAQLKTFNCTSLAIIVTSGTCNVSKARSKTKIAHPASRQWQAPSPRVIKTLFNRRSRANSVRQSIVMRLKTHAQSHESPFSHTTYDCHPCT